MFVTAFPGPLYRFVFFLFSLSLSPLCFCQNNDSLQYQFSKAIYQAIQKDSGYWRGGGTSVDLSLIGLYKEALIEFDKPRPYPPSIKAADRAAFRHNYHAVDARKFIVEKAKENRVIIFNEAHYNSRNRVFLTSLLKDLKAIGYNYLAAEAFINDSSFNQKQHPTFETGYYTMEPAFGNLVRQATKLGYTLYPYEAAGLNGGQREMGQAKNISALLEKNSTAKVIVYCGFDHVLEDTVLNWGKAMAGRLKEITNIDPFTIDQIVLSERSILKLNNPYYNLVNAKDYSILVDDNGNPFSNGRVDALLYAPPTNYRYNRPAWVFENGKIPFFLSKDSIQMAFPILVKAYLETDDLMTSIPVDIIEIKNEEELAETAISVFRNENVIFKISNPSGGYQLINIKR